MTPESNGEDSITIIGAGQAGLATGYYLQKSGLEFTMLADDDRIGDSWRDRWDSLRLFTPAFYNSLPGMEFPADDPEHLPGKDEVADTDESRKVWLVGPDTGDIPRRLLGRDFYRWAGPTLLNLKRNGILGRRLYERTAGNADPVFSNERQKMQEVGVKRVVSRITDVESGRPSTADGDRFDVNNVIWCTGFRPEYSWIDIDVFQDDGYPRHTRGVVTEVPGLYFVGLPWMYRLSSSLLGDVGRDAEHIASRIRTRVQNGQLR